MVLMSIVSSIISATKRLCDAFSVFCVANMAVLGRECHRGPTQSTNFAPAPCRMALFGDSMLHRSVRVALAELLPVAKTTLFFPPPPRAGYAAFSVPRSRSGRARRCSRRGWRGARSAGRSGGAPLGAQVNAVITHCSPPFSEGVVLGYAVQMNGRALCTNPLVHGRYIVCNGLATKQVWVESNGEDR